MKDIGFNSMRIPYCNEMFRPESEVTGVDYYLNPDLVGLRPLDAMEKILNFAGSIGIRIIMDRHSAKVNNYAGEPLWYIEGDAYYTEERFISDWEMIARRFKGTTVMGADLWNEPKQISSWGSGVVEHDWHLAAQRVGNAILAITPEWLIFVEGIGTNTWWGGNLHYVAQFPVVLNVPNQLVYSVHEYCLDVDHTSSWFYDPTFPHNLYERWDYYFGYIFEQQIAPIWIGEYGTMFKFDQDYVWLDMWVNYTNGYFHSSTVNELPPGHLGMSWAFWAVSPGGDVGGILKSDWVTVEEEKLAYLRRAMYPILPFIPPNATETPRSNRSWVVPMPSATPTHLPQPFHYFSTKGSQIVDSAGKPVRFIGINW